MKKWQLLLIVLSIQGVFIWILLTEFSRDTPYRRQLYNENIKPLVETSIYGVITQINRRGRRQDVYYFDFTENWEKRLSASASEPLHVGDTIRKGAGQNHFVWKRHGNVYWSYPIDSKKP